jgi:hypothetical protein
MLCCIRRTGSLAGRETHSITHSTGRDKEKALQQKSLQSLIFTQSGRRDLNPRPPEPHADQGNHLKRQLVGFSMASERRRRVPLAEMSGFAGRNGTKNGTPSLGRNLSTPPCFGVVESELDASHAL